MKTVKKTTKKTVKKATKKVVKPYELVSTPHGKINMIVNNRVESVYMNMDEAEKAALLKYGI
jgi:hypothetical protein